MLCSVAGMTTLDREWDFACMYSHGKVSTYIQSLPRVVGPYTLSNLCQRLYAKNLGKIRLSKGNLI